LVFFVFNPALVGSNLASTVTIETIKIIQLRG
nr:auxin efflux carrier [Tanacetum cinerariifolium]